MHLQAVPHNSIRWHYGTAEHIPLADGSVDGVLCILASHHFSSLETAATEMARICASGPIAWFTFDPRQVETPWLRDYFPAIWDSALEAFPPIEDISHLLEKHASRNVTATPWLIPHDLQDYFMAAGWRRPEMYLDPEVRAGMSAFALADPFNYRNGLSRLQYEIKNGEWKSKYGYLLERELIDWGYRFLIATKAGEQSVPPDRLCSR